MCCKRIFLTIPLLLFFLPLFSQEVPKVKYLGSSSGLSNSSVKCIYQDRQGIIWFGTYDGLNRYDGYEFRIFRNRINDSTSLPHNYICAINEDDAHNLWIGMGQGVVTHNPLTHVFVPVYYQPYHTKSREKIAGYVNDIERDRKGNMFVSTSTSGLLLMLKGRRTAMQVPYKTIDGEWAANGASQAVTIGPENQVWVCIGGNGLYKYNYTTGVLDAVNTSLRQFAVNNMIADTLGNLWLGTTAGVLKYSVTGNSIVATYTREQNGLGANYVSGLNIDNRGTLWIGSDGGGIDLLDINTGNITNIESGNVRGLLSSESILSVFIDKESRKWIGTLKGGVDIIDPAGNEFRIIRKDLLYPGLSSNFITSFFEDDSKNLWIGTEGGGICVWSADRKQFKKYQAPALSNNTISSITQDAGKNTWVATFGGGINRIDKNGNIAHYPLIDNEDGHENKIAIYVYEDKQGNIWATTYENGRLYLFNKSLNKFEVFDRQIGDLMSIKEDKNGVLWAGNSYQLVLIDRLHKKHRFFDIGKTVRAIHEDAKGNFWIGSEGGGLILFDRKAGKIVKRYSEENGLSSNTVMNIVEDNSGCLWISTSNGLSKFDPVQKKFSRFYESDGLQGNQFSYRGALKLKSGELVFGGNNGFNLFDPARITSRNYMPAVVITSLRINNKDISPNHNFATDANGNITRLTIPYNEAILSVQFAALEYSEPDKIQYAYYLDGWDNQWNVSGNLRTVTYNNIREGSYTLRIKSTNAEGVWNTKETLVKITVLPPWYRTWWAYAIYLATIGALIFLYLRYKTNQARMKYELQLSRLNAEMRKAELESERMEKEVQRAELEKTHAEYEREKAERETERVVNEKEKEINQKRLSFFTNISHEFRTPLTLIINPIHELISQYQGKEKEELRVIGRNARRLLSLTDQLLLFRKIEEGAEGVSVSRFDFSKLCNTVFLYFKHEAKTKNIQYAIEGIEHPIELYGDRNKIEIILYNLIANAFKYTPKKGTITIKVEKVADTLKTVISDTGAGIPEGTGAAIFERFYQAEGHVKLGFGIGLYMVKQFTEMHKGTISYKSVPGQGTTFMLGLPLGKDHFDNTQVATEEIAEDGYANILSEDREEEQEHAYMPELPVLTKDKAILVVDDDEEIRNYIVSIFVENYIVYEAVNGVEGVKLARKKRPDLIISDIAMPGMDGIELCKTIKNDNSINHLPVILLTAHTSREVELKGTEEGADYYVTKPFSKELLLARVNSLFKSRQNLQQYFYDHVTLKKRDAEEQTVPVEYQELLDKCIAVVEKHLDDGSFNIETLAREMGMSHSYLYKRIKLISGQSVNSFIRYLRLRKAAEFLINTNDTVSEVAYQVGFNDVKYFREQFAKLFKMKPTDYIKQYRGTLGEKLRIGTDPIEGGSG